MPCDRPYGRQGGWLVPRRFALEGWAAGDKPPPYREQSVPHGTGSHRFLLNNGQGGQWLGKSPVDLIERMAEEMRNADRG